MRALEIGYRWQRGTTSVDFTAFRNAYTGLKGSQPGVPSVQLVQGQPALVVPVLFTNLLNAQTFGVGALAHWQLSRIPRRNTLAAGF